jgi:hypothetical protein
MGSVIVNYTTGGTTVVTAGVVVTIGATNVTFCVFCVTICASDFVLPLGFLPVSNPMTVPDNVAAIVEDVNNHTGIKIPPDIDNDTIEPDIASTIPNIVVRVSLILLENVNIVNLL